MNYALMKEYYVPHNRDMLNFDDVDYIEDWALSSVILLTEAGVLSGDGASFNPTSTSTRAEAAQILMNFLRFIAQQPLFFLHKL
jgi:hypothetical protein